MGDSNHHIHFFEKSHPETIIIWVGTFANVSRTKKADVKLCEKMLTSDLTNVELDENKHENQTNKRPPSETVYIINEWYRVKKNNAGDYDDHEDYNSKNKDAIPNIVPDVMCYYAETSALYRVKKLRWVANISS